LILIVVKNSPVQKSKIFEPQTLVKKIFHDVD
jgi:hypothetical protein